MVLGAMPGLFWPRLRSLGKRRGLLGRDGFGRDQRLEMKSWARGQKVDQPQTMARGTGPCKRSASGGDGLGEREKNGPVLAVYLGMKKPLRNLQGLIAQRHPQDNRTGPISGTGQSIASNRDGFASFKHSPTLH